MNKYQILFLLLAIFFFLGLMYLYFFTSFYSWFRVENINSYIASNQEYAIFVFWLLNFFGALLFIPLTLFWLVAGMLFGSFIGTLLCSTAATTAATTAFLLSQKQRWLIDILVNKSQNADKWVNKIEGKFTKNSFTLLFIIRVLPHPFILLSYLAGISRGIKLKTFILATFWAILPISFTFVLLGDSLLNDIRIILLPITLIILVTQLPKLLRNFQ